MKINVDKCVGCSACYFICPTKSITMEKTPEGFLYPKIDNDKCVKCGMCDTVCPINFKSYNQISHLTYAYQNNDNIRENSTSGGFFTLISDYILGINGIVYGAIYDEKFKVIHSRASNIYERNKMRNSKYVQSDLGDVFLNVSNDLKNDLNVLFTGNPCQISGLLNYLKMKKISTKKLITCDFICHGVPSPRVWNDYLIFVSHKNKDEIKSINFREKTMGWHNPRLSIEFKNKNIKQELNQNKDPFYNLFYSNCILRMCCHNCDYCRLNRVSDITMGDCWGIEKSKPELDDNKGLSFVMINSDKGEEIISCLNGKWNGHLISVSDLKQPHLYSPAYLSKKRKKFWIEYDKHSFLYIINRYGNYSLITKAINVIKRTILRIIKK